MKKLSFQKVSKEGIVGWVGEEIWGLLPSRFFEDPVSSVEEMGGQLIKKSGRRVAAILRFPEGKGIFFKRDRVQGWKEPLKYLLFPSKARKEWRVADRLSGRNLNIPRPLGWMEKRRWGFLIESYYLSEAVGSGTSFIEESAQKREDFYLDELAAVVRRMHDSGLFHRDLHAGNFLWEEGAFFLTDLHRAKVVRSVSPQRRLLNLAQLLHSLRSCWGEGERLRFIERYIAGKPAVLVEKEEILRKVHLLMARLQRRQWQSRTKRCLKKSTEFSVRKEERGTVYHRRDFSVDRLKNVIEEHLAMVRERPWALAKRSPEVIVSIVNDGKGKVGVKQFLHCRFGDGVKDLFRPSKAFRAWVAGNGLAVRGVPSLRPLALWERREGRGRKESFLVMEASEKGLEMDRYILRGFGDIGRKRLFVRHFAGWLARLHQRNVYHQDMKTCNLVVSEKGEAWDFHLLDLEDLRLEKKIAEKGLFKNLLQLNTSIPKSLTRTDRWRFFKEYTRLQPIVKDEKIFVDQLIQKSKERGVVYVSSEGVIQEKFF